MKKTLISLGLALFLAVPVVGFAQVSDEAQFNNLQITSITPAAYGQGMTQLTAVSNSDIRCISYSAASFAYPCQPQIVYTIRVESDTILLLQNRTRTSISSFAVGDKINVYGFYTAGSNFIDALIMRKLNSSTAVRYYTQVNSLTVQSAPGTIPSTITAAAQGGAQYTINISGSTTLLYRDRRLMPIYEVQAGDSINVYGLFNPATLTFDAVILRDLSRPAVVVVPPPQGNLTFTVTTDKQVYNQDENIFITLRAYNNSPYARTLNFNTGCQVSYVIEGYYDQSQNRFCTQSLTAVNIPAYGSYTWTTTHTPGTFRLMPGTYRLRDSVIGYGDTTTTFTVSGTTSSNSTPIITSVSGPTNLSMGQTGTWAISAYDPDNNGNNLTYSVTWGDEFNYAYGSAAAPQSNMQTGTFTHTYGNAGTYTVRFTVRDTSGLSAVSTLTVNVGGSAIGGIPTISTISPNYGPIGTYVTLYGSGFTSDNMIFFGSGAIAHVSSYDGRTLSFSVPSYFNPPCYYSTPACLMASSQVTPGTYQVSVGNSNLANGRSNAVNFTVQ